MDPHDRAVDHLDLTIVRLRHGVHQPVPDAFRQRLKRL